MKKQEIIEALKKYEEGDKRRADDIFNLLIKTICIGLERDGRVHVVGLGTFIVKQTKPRPAYNMHMMRTTGKKQQITVPSRSKIVFKPYYKLKLIQTL